MPDLTKLHSRLDYRKVGKCAIGLPFLLLLTAWGALMGTTPSASVVTLSTFSGRPNPTWTLDQEQVAVLKEIVTSLQPTGSPQESLKWPPYMGFLVVSGDIVGSAGGLVEVYDGIVTIRDITGQEIIWLADPDYKVERYLFETAKAHVDAAVYQSVVDRFHELIR